GELGDAVAVLERARLEHVDEPVAHVALAGVYSEQDRVDDAVDVLTEAEERFPENTLIVFQLGAVLEQGQRYREAEGAFRRVLERNPDDAATLNYLGYMLAERGDRLEESVELIRRALEFDPNNGSYLDSLGWAYFKQDEFELAETPLRAASDQLPRNSVVQDHMGDLLFRLGRYSEAIGAWERALAGDGDGLDLTMVEGKIRDVKARLER
ncbi:MAG: tetratricopeptide repeat protein, partial [Acidobacteriota bacterium]|nr:tetratricopeptide repeat protein [Acidobacteriota bacterium]